ncbi:MAG TPA: hypothetical protein PLV70_15100, partial [Flavobacteriales bacterium]|nr:hypothetical protein [Flavobacteriales bacterium]
MLRAFLLLATGACALASARAQAPLCVDESFQFGHAPIGELASVVFMDDGRIIAGGVSIRKPTVVIQHTGITRVMPNGAIDPGFGPSYVLFGDCVTIKDDYIFLQSGGTGFRRLFLADGTNDYSYVINPYYGEFQPSQVSSYHNFPDGKQWRLGKLTRYQFDEEGNQILQQPGYGLVQALPNGSYDPDFDHKYTPETYLRNLSVEPDGRFLISASNAFTYEGTPVGALFKLWPDGHLDTTFHTSITWSGGVSDEKYHYPDGRMLVFGRFMAPEYPDDTLAVMRLLPDGSTDTTWPSIPFLAYGYFRGLAAIWDYLEIEPGKLIVVGDFNAIGHQPLGDITVIDTAGNVLWDYLPGTGVGFTEPIDNHTPICRLHGIDEGPDGYIYVWGAFSGYNDGCGDHPEQRLLMRLYPLNVGVGEAAATVPALSVYPNPAYDRLYVAWDMPGKFSVLVGDLQGRTWLEQNLRSGDAPLDISKLSPDVYLLSVIS